MRARSALLLVVFLGALIGCNRINPPAGNDPATSGSPNGTKDDPNADVGKPLYELRGAPMFPPLPLAGTEPVVIANAYVQYEDRQQVSSEVDGMIDLIASPLPQRADGRYEWKQADGTTVLYDPARPHPSIVFHPRDRVRFPKNPEQWLPYWKLGDGQHVVAGQIICLIDDQLVTTKMKAAAKLKVAALEVRKQAKNGVESVERKIELYKNNPAVVAEVQKLDDLTTLSRFLENLAQADQSIVKAEQDHDEAELMLGKHVIRSRVDGIIRQVAKRAGETTRVGEKIFEIQSTEKVRIEGNLDSQYAMRLKTNTIVTVEPAFPSAPIASHPAGHRQEVGSVAITGHATRPLVVSAGLDGSVLVWDPNLGRAKDKQGLSHNLPHPVPVRAVACTPPGEAVLVVTGANDGKIRIWDLTDLVNLPEKPKFEPADFHLAGVTAIAVSPDGKFAATAAGREVFIWDLAAGKKLYSLPPEHRDSVTSVMFTPQGQLVTAARDRTLKVWKLGEKMAAVARTVEHRSGVVDTLSVSPDGGRMLFDLDKNRLDLVNITDGQTIGQLANVGPNVAFATLAVFGPERGPDNPYTVVTAGGEGDLKGGLQVWQAPRAGGRAAEIARLITPGREGVTCVAFSPHKSVPFLVAGTDRGKVHIWTPSSEPARRLEGRITNIEPTDPRYFTVRVEMLNKDVGLPDHTTATIIIPPGQ